ncbi:MAG: response regulator [Thermoanaerobaculaceae bacterium]|nr:response regulator [Thermoanaerobaculaceae bacterium]
MKNKALAPTILIVEDEAIVLATLKRFLEKQGYIAETANSYNTAIELLKVMDFETVIADVNLGGENAYEGIELIREIKRKRLTTAVICLTAYGGMERMEKAFAAGADAYYEKPIRMEILLNAIKLGYRKEEK